MERNVISCLEDAKYQESILRIVYTIKTTEIGEKLIRPISAYDMSRTDKKLFLEKGRKKMKRKTRKIINSVSEIQKFMSEDEERAWWVDHDFSEKFYKELKDTAKQFDELLPLPLSRVSKNWPMVKSFNS